MGDARFCQRCGAPMGEADALIGSTVMGRYRVVKLLGEGSMGRVYLGEQRVGEGVRAVAIKVLAAARGNDDYIVARFRREASTVASLEHPNIIKLYDYGEEGGRFLSVMEYVPGGSVAALIARGRLNPQRVEAIVWQIASALDEAHRREVVHRDLKPENVLIASTAESPAGVDVVKVVDFGIARRAPVPGERPLTITGAMLGTPAFMAPEQFMGEPADARVDVYALALVAYQMLTGVLPWTAGSVMEWGEAHLHVAPRPLRTQPGCEALPERYDMAIAHALAKNPQQRTASALEFARSFTGSSQPGNTSSVIPPVVPGALPPEAMLAPLTRTPVGLIVTVAIVLVLISLGVGFLVLRSAVTEATSSAVDATSPPSDASLLAAHDAPRADHAALGPSAIAARDAGATRPAARAARRTRPTERARQAVANGQ